MSVCVVTDPSAVMPRSWTTDLPVHLIRLDLAWPDGRIDPGDMTYTDLAARLHDGERAPRTGAPSPGVYRSLFEELLMSNDGVLVVCPASDLSTTYASASLAARELGDRRVRVLDARTAAAGQGLVAGEAAKAAAAGDDADAVLDRALEVAKRVQVWATLAQLEYLKNSGRVPAIAAIGAGALHLQPIVRYAGGSPTPVGVARTSARGAERLFRAWERTFVQGVMLHLIAFHSAREQEAEELRDKVAGIVPLVEAYAVEVTASLGSHTGPGLLGLAWFWDN